MRSDLHGDLRRSNCNEVRREAFCIAVVPSDPPHTSDTELSSAQIWTSFQDALRGYVSKKIAVAADVDDVLQDIFIRIHKGASEIREAERVQSWVFAVAHGAIADYYRTRYRKPPAYPIEEHAVTIAGDDSEEVNLAEYEGEHDVHEEVLSWLEPMISRLPEKYAVALRLSDIEGRSQIEIAEELGISHSGAKSRVQRARRMLGKVLTDCCSIEFGSEGKVVAFDRLRRKDR